VPDSPKGYVLIPDKELEKELWLKPSETRLIIDQRRVEVSVAELFHLPPARTRSLPARCAKVSRG